jgi:hypothetical protein
MTKGWDHGGRTTTERGYGWSHQTMRERLKREVVLCEQCRRAARSAPAFSGKHNPKRQAKRSHGDFAAPHRPSVVRVDEHCACAATDQPNRPHGQNCDHKYPLLALGISLASWGQASLQAVVTIDGRREALPPQRGRQAAMPGNGGAEWLAAAGTLAGREAV